MGGRKDDEINRQIRRKTLLQAASRNGLSRNHLDWTEVRLVEGKATNAALVACTLHCSIDNRATNKPTEVEPSSQDRRRYFQGLNNAVGSLLGGGPAAQTLVHPDTHASRWIITNGGHVVDSALDVLRRAPATVRQKKASLLIRSRRRREDKVSSRTVPSFLPGASSAAAAACTHPVVKAYDCISLVSPDPVLSEPFTHKCRED